MVRLAAIDETFVAALLGSAGYFYYTGAEDFCQRTLNYSERVRPPWRSILYPRWFWGTRRCVRQMQITGVGAMFMGALLLVIAALTIFHSR